MVDLLLFLTIFLLFIISIFYLNFQIIIRKKKKIKQTVQIFIPIQVFYFRIQQKINLVLLFRLKNPENQYMSHKKYGVHLGLVAF